ncbi:MAG: hypothetical protein WC666_04225 [Candidatus Paceibacterota bacterium]|jgi:hypothetical protein
MNNKLAEKITIASLEKTLTDKKYPALKIGVNFLNIIGVRANTGVTDSFDDIIAVAYKDSDDHWVLEKFSVTTDPGKHYLTEFANPKGTGILVPGYYKQSHKVGLHKGEYKALVQYGPLKVYRDSDKDQQYDVDPKTIETGMFGVNIHRSNPAHESVVVDKWSAACQVFSNPKQFYRFINTLVSNHVAIYGDIFDYILLEEKDLA